ncbi:hypothetical protein T310_0517, partial [Rasamsonia emersonii CBS 393.64]
IRRWLWPCLSVALPPLPSRLFADWRHFGRNRDCGSDSCTHIVRKKEMGVQCQCPSSENLQINIIELELLQTGVDGSGHIVNGLDDLCRDEKLLAGDSAFFDSYSDFCLGPVGFGAINVSVSLTDCTLHHFNQLRHKRAVHVVLIPCCSCAESHLAELVHVPFVDNTIRSNTIGIEVPSHNIKAGILGVMVLWW